jgi:hypothetical protein
LFLALSVTQFFRIAASFRPRSQSKDANGAQRSVRSGDAHPAVDPAGQARHDVTMYFEILGEISSIETFATGSGIREIARLRRIYRRGRWRKRKGVARVRLTDGSIHVAEVH